MCLFGSEIRWKKNFIERKWKGKLFWNVFSWVERKKNKLWGSGIFSLGLPKSFLLNIKRKLKWKIGHNFWTKTPMCNCTWASSRCFSSQFFFFFLNFFHLDSACLLFFTCYFLKFIGQALPASSSSPSSSSSSSV